MKKIIMMLGALLFTGGALWANPMCSAPIELSEKEVSDAISFNNAGLLYKDYLKARRMNLDAENYKVYRQNMHNKKAGFLYGVLGAGLIVQSVRLGAAGVYALYDPADARQKFDQRLKVRNFTWSDHMTVDDTRKAGIAALTAGGSALLGGIIFTAMSSSRFKNSRKAVIRQDGIRLAVAPQSGGAVLAFSSKF